MTGEREEALAFLALMKAKEAELKANGGLRSKRVDNNTVVVTKAEDLEHTLSRMGVSNAPTRRYIPSAPSVRDKEVRRKICEMWREGYRVKDIMSELGLTCSVTTVRSIGCTESGADYRVEERNEKKRKRYGTLREKS